MDERPTEDGHSRLARLIRSARLTLAAVEAS